MITGQDEGPVPSTDLLSAALHRWDCAVDGDPLRGGTAVIIPVRSVDGSELIVKLLDAEAATREALALRAFPPTASVQCLDHLPDLGALLLERLTPAPLAGVPIDEQITIQSRLARALAVPAPEGIDRLSSERLAHHLTNLRHGAPGHLAGRVIDRAHATISNLDSDPTSTLTHGDLHSLNVHQDHKGVWRALDPNPHVGTIAFESHTVIAERPRLGELIQAGDRELRRRLGIFADIAEVDCVLAERLCQARAVMSALYEQARGATELADQLRWMATTLTP